MAERQNYIAVCELCQGSGWRTWWNKDGYLCGNACKCTVTVKDRDGVRIPLTHDERQATVRSYVVGIEGERKSPPKRQWMGKKLVPHNEYLIIDGKRVKNKEWKAENPLCWKEVFGVWNDDEIPQHIIDQLWGGE